MVTAAGTKAALATTALSFDHRHPGTPEERWRGATLLDAASPLDLAAVRRLVVVSAHPDDETLGAGGLLATAAARGVAVSVVVASDGEASHPDSTTHPAAALGARRRAEVRAALDTLAPAASVTLLGLADGRLTDHPGALAAAVRSAVGDGGPGTVIAAPWREDRHPDHAAVGEAAALVAAEVSAQLLEFPVWAWHWDRPDGGVLAARTLVVLRFDVTTRAKKQRAMACHASQLSPLSDQPGDEAVVPAGFAAHFDRPHEVFVTEPAPGRHGLDERADRSADPGQATAGERSLPLGYFDALYEQATDPWGFENRWYESRKRAITMASLPRERFSNAFEPGCSIGVLTGELAGRCDALLASDIASAPLEVARARLAERPWVRFEQRRLPKDWPDGTFDLVVLSEIGYYCSATDLAQLIERAAVSLAPAGVLVACHWRHPVEDYPISGDQVHATLRSRSGLAVLAGHVEEDFRLDVLVPPPALSVARRGGLV